MVARGWARGTRKGCLMGGAGLVWEDGHDLEMTVVMATQQCDVLNTTENM